jgi:hypothetical protein
VAIQLRTASEAVPYIHRYGIISYHSFVYIQGISLQSDSSQSMGHVILRCFGSGRLTLSVGTRVPSGRPPNRTPRPSSPASLQILPIQQPILDPVFFSHETIPTPSSCGGFSCYSDQSLSLDLGFDGILGCWGASIFCRKYMISIAHSPSTPKPSPVNCPRCSKIELKNFYIDL